MDLEAVERKCLAYLKQVQNPLVPISQLFRHLTLDESLVLPSEAQFIAFLREHELFKVIDPVGLAADSAGAKSMQEAGLNAEPFVVLCTRVPTENDLADMLRDQMRQIVSALFVATRQAQESGNEEYYARAKELLQRASTLEGQLDASISPRTKREN
jgi:hypothetical protein